MRGGGSKRERGREGSSFIEKGKIVMTLGIISVVEYKFVVDLILINIHNLSQQHALVCS